MPLATILTWQPRVFEWDVNEGEALGAVSAKRDGYTGLAVGAEASFDVASLLGKGDTAEEDYAGPDEVAEQEAEAGEAATEEAELPTEELVAGSEEQAATGPGELGAVEFEGSLAGTLAGG